MYRLLFLIAAYLFVGLALIGVVVPGLPTVPFLLLAAGCSARGSERLHRWLYEHPTLGKLLIDWERQGAIARRSKWIAVSLLVVSWCVMALRVDRPWLLALAGVMFVGIASFLLTRPEPD